ncbi:hypothetical protein KR009_006361 [Drosophila setifemur]|nr:hypothetical protein KR009_006361 [Drosophila setifemur]
MSKATKLRFALITEDVLNKLRPRSQSENHRSNYMNEIYTAIRTAVTEVVDNKMQELSRSLNQMVDDKVDRIMELQELHFQHQQQQQGRRTAGGPYLMGSARRKEGYPKDKGKVPDVPDNSKTSLKPKRQRRVVKPKAGQDQQQQQKLPEEEQQQQQQQQQQQGKRGRPRVQKVTVRPSHRETLVTPERSTPSHTSPGPTLAHKLHNTPEQNTLEDDFSDVEEPSILTIAAKYLKQLEDARRRKHQQNLQYQHYQ